MLPRLLGILFIALLCAGCVGSDPSIEGESQSLQSTTPQTTGSLESTDDNETTEERTTEEETTVLPVEELSPDMAALESRLRELASTSEGRVGISVRGLEGYAPGTEASAGEGEVFRSASIIKLLVLAQLLREVDEGNISLDDRLGNGRVSGNASSMISYSDNASTNLLVDRLGGFDPVNGLAAELGLADTVLARNMLDIEAAARGEENYTSASDISELLAEIYGSRLLSPESRRYALKLLESQKLDAKIPSGLPADTRVLHKTGELEGIEHDAGIIITPEGRAFVLVVLTEGDSTTNTGIIREVAQTTYETMTDE